MTETLVSIGTVRSVRPLTREVRVTPRPGREPIFETMAWVRVMLDGAPVRCKVAKTAMHGGEAILTLAAGVPRDTVGRMKGAALVCTPEELPAGREDAWNLEEMMGWRVVEENGAPYGAIVEAYTGPANIAIAVERPGGGRAILPLIEELVLDADTANGVLRIGDPGPYAVEMEESADACE